MDCPSCKATNEPRRRFCGQCGVRLVQTCESCGFANLTTDRYCGGCGVVLGGEARTQPASLARTEPPRPAPKNHPNLPLDKQAAPEDAEPEEDDVPF